MCLINVTHHISNLIVECHSVQCSASPSINIFCLLFCAMIRWAIATNVTCGTTTPAPRIIIWMAIYIAVVDNRRRRHRPPLRSPVNATSAAKRNGRTFTPCLAAYRPWWIRPSAPLRYCSSVASTHRRWVIAISIRQMKRQLPKLNVKPKKKWPNSDGMPKRLSIKWNDRLSSRFSGLWRLPRAVPSRWWPRNGSKWRKCLQVCWFSCDHWIDAVSLSSPSLPGFCGMKHTSCGPGGDTTHDTHSTHTTHTTHTEHTYTYTADIPNFDCIHFF